MVCSSGMNRENVMPAHIDEAAERITTMADKDIQWHYDSNQMKKCTQTLFGFTLYHDAIQKTCFQVLQHFMMDVTSRNSTSFKRILILRECAAAVSKGRSHCMSFKSLMFSLLSRL